MRALSSALKLSMSRPCMFAVTVWIRFAPACRILARPFSCVIYAISFNNNGLPSGFSRGILPRSATSSRAVLSSTTLKPTTWLPITICAIGRLSLAARIVSSISTACNPHCANWSGRKRITACGVPGGDCTSTSRAPLMLVITPAMRCASRSNASKSSPYRLMTVEAA